MPLHEANDIISTFGEVLDQVKERRFDPEKQVTERKEKLGVRKSLILLANIQTVEYEEARREALRTFPTDPHLPKNLRLECASCLTNAKEWLGFNTSIGRRRNIKSGVQCSLTTWA